MKFFAALLAKLTGGDTAPKTLDAAKATFAEAKAALDRIGAMFAAAALDFDALLAAGETGLKDFVAGLQGKITAAENALTEAAGKVASAESKVSEAQAEVSRLSSLVTCHTSLLSSIGFKPAEVKGTDGKAPTAEQTAAGLQEQFKAHVAGSVTQKLQELGVPAAGLPKAAPAGAGAAATEEDLLAQLAEAKTPAEKGRIGAALNALRNKQWGQN